MKKIILVSILFWISHAAYSQKFTLDGFWGIPFKSSKETCKKEVLSKYGYKPDEKRSQGPGSLCYQDVKYGSIKTQGILMGFLNDEMFVGKALLIPDATPKLLELYEKVVHDIGMKYHAPNETKEKFTYPFDENMSDGQKIIAISGGYAEIWSRWKFDAGQGMENNLIELEVKDGFLVLTYGYGQLYKLLEQAEKQKNSDVY